MTKVSVFNTSHIVVFNLVHGENIVFWPNAEISDSILIGIYTCFIFHILYRFSIFIIEKERNISE